VEAGPRSEGSAGAGSRPRPRLALAWRLLPENGHLPVLDGLRGLAMLLVFLYHVVVYPPWRRPFAIGWIGIELFFVLSGFLITGLIVDSTGERHQLRNFYVRRALRILPLYYLVLAVLYVCTWVQGGPAAERVLGEQAWFWLLQSNLQMAFEGWYKPLYFAHFWSLAHEIQFYAVWPLLLVALGPRRALLATGVIAAASFTLRNALPVAWPFSYAATFNHLEGMMAGSAIALLLRQERGALGRVAPWALVAAGLPLAWLALRPTGLHISDEHVMRFVYPALAVFFGALLCSTFEAGRVGRASRAVFCAKLFLWIGKYSYGIYLSHWVIHLQLKRPLLEWLTPAFGEAGAHALSVLIQVLLVGALSFAGYHLVELPALRLKNVLAPRPRGRMAELPEREFRKTA
jgi:peptidoglycan/LPS O-acetylase OafA/YrhL